MNQGCALLLVDWLTCRIRANRELKFFKGCALLLVDWLTRSIRANQGLVPESANFNTRIKELLFLVSAQEGLLKNVHFFLKHLVSSIILDNYPQLICGKYFGLSQAAILFYLRQLSQAPVLHNLWQLPQTFLGNYLSLF